MMRGRENCCHDANLVSCNYVDIDPSILSSNEISINGINFTLSNLISPHGYNFKNNQMEEATLSYNPSTRNLFGTIKTRQGTFLIEKCRHGHVLKEISPRETSLHGRMDDDLKHLKKEMMKNLDMKAEPYEFVDNTTVVTYSVMFYYTPEFAKAVDDIEGFIDHIITVTNQGYINSKIPVRATKLCIEQAKLHDSDVMNENLEPLMRMKGSLCALTNSADVVTLLVQENGQPFCFDNGYGNFAAYRDGYAISVVKGSCAASDFAFAHQVGRHFGADYNIEETTNPLFSYGHGFLVEPRCYGFTGLRTIMALARECHYERINQYSNPNNLFYESCYASPNGTCCTCEQLYFGVENVSNNAAVLTRNRFAIAALGDESGSCRPNGPLGVLWDINQQLTCKKNDILGSILPVQPLSKVVPVD